MTAKIDGVLMASLERLSDRLSLLEDNLHFGLCYNKLNARVVHATITADQVASQLVEIMNEYLHEVEPIDIANGRFPYNYLKDALDSCIRQHSTSITSDSLRSAVSRYVQSLSFGSYTQRIVYEAIERVYGH